MTTRRSFLAASSGLLAIGAQAQGANDYPSKPVTIVLSNAVGGALDVVAREIAQKMTGSWKQPAIVDARPGANGLIAAGLVARSAPDGYTTLFTNSSFVLNLQLRPETVTLEEFTPLGLVAFTPNALAISNKLPARNLQEFVALVKTQPGKHSFGSLGPGSTGHFLGEMINKEADIDVVHTPYRGESPMITDLISGQISAAWGSAGNLARQAAAGKCRLIAIGNTKRVKAFPEIPTLGESGFPSLNMSSGWFGMFGPRGIPPATQAKISDEIARASVMPDVALKITDFGFEATGMPHAEFASFLKNEYAKWNRIIKTTGIKLTS